MRNSFSKRISQIALGHSLLSVLDFSFDRILYPFVLVKSGTVNGWVILTIASGLIGFLLIIVYERMKIDWLGVNVLEEIKRRGNQWIEKVNNKVGLKWFVVKIVVYIPSKILLAVIWCLNKNDVIAFFVLSLYEDAFKTTAFLRHGKFDGLRAKDWFVFSASLVVSNIWWTLQWSILLIPLKWAWHTIFN